MTPGSFDCITAREVIGDSTARVIEARARSDADAGVARADLAFVATTYWGQVKDEMCRVIYESQYAKRSARNQRKAGT